MVDRNSPRNPTWFWLNVFLAIGLLLPAMYGFGTKFYEFLQLYGGYLKVTAAGTVALESPPPLSPGEAIPQPRKVPTRGAPMVDEATEGAFALMPILNYLIVSAGFTLLFIGAVMRGMFYDVEKPKYDMLAQEQVLDEWRDEEFARDHPEAAMIRPEVLA